MRRHERLREKGRQMGVRVRSLLSSMATWAGPTPCGGNDGLEDEKDRGLSKSLRECGIKIPGGDTGAYTPSGAMRLSALGVRGRLSITMG